MPFRPYLRSLLLADRFQRDAYRSVAEMRRQRDAQERKTAQILYPPPPLEGRGVSVDPPKREAA